MFFKSSIRKIFKRKKSYRAHLRELNQEFQSFKDLYLFETSKNEKNHHFNPLNRFGAKCFSQSDEDGITLEIIKRIGIIENGTFAEFGVADGTENLTLILISLGWKGFWVGGDQLAYRTPNNEKFNYIQKWITKENILDIITEAKNQLHLKDIDVISLDLDGNDIHFVRELLNHQIHPKLFIVEYNAKFIPPLEFEIPYDAKHQWLGDDYFGASLASFVMLFEANDYRLICCNSATGANAFFIKNSYSDLFPEVPTEILSLYSPPRYYLPKKFGHPQSTKTLEALFLRK